MGIELEGWFKMEKKEAEGLARDYVHKVLGNVGNVIFSWVVHPNRVEVSHGDTVRSFPFSTIKIPADRSIVWVKSEEYEDYQIRMSAGIIKNGCLVCYGPKGKEKFNWDFWTDTCPDGWGVE